MQNALGDSSLSSAKERQAASPNEKESLVQNLKLGRIASVLVVSDMARACEFYRKVFGLSVTFESGEPASYVILKQDDAELHLSLVEDYQGSVHNVAHIMVSDADEVHRRAVDAGASIIKELRDAPWGLRTFVLADLEGNRIDVGARLG